MGQLSGLKVEGKGMRPCDVDSVWGSVSRNGKAWLPASKQGAEAVVADQRMTLCSRKVWSFAFDVSLTFMYTARGEEPAVANK